MYLRRTFYILSDCHVYLLQTCPFYTDINYFKFTAKILFTFFKTDPQKITYINDTNFGGLQIKYLRIILILYAKFPLQKIFENFCSKT